MSKDKFNKSKEQYENLLKTQLVLTTTIEITDRIAILTAAEVAVAEVEKSNTDKEWPSQAYEWLYQAFEKLHQKSIGITSPLFSDNQIWKLALLHAKKARDFSNQKATAWLATHEPATQSQNKEELPPSAEQPQNNKATMPESSAKVTRVLNFLDYFTQKPRIDGLLNAYEKGCHTGPEKETIIRNDVSATVKGVLGLEGSSGKAGLEKLDSFKKILASKKETSENFIIAVIKFAPTGGFAKTLRDCVLVLTDQLKDDLTESAKWAKYNEIICKVYTKHDLQPPTSKNAMIAWFEKGIIRKVVAPKKAYTENSLQQETPASTTEQDKSKSQQHTPPFIPS